MKELLVATRNKKKLQEIKDLLKDLDFKITSIDDYPDMPEIEEDSKADMDMNVVMLDNGHFVEIQGTAEGKSFSKQDADALLELADKGIRELITIQKSSLPHLDIPSR